MAKEKLKKVSLTKEVKAAIIVSFLAIFLFGGIMLLSTKENDDLIVVNPSIDEEEDKPGEEVQTPVVVEEKLAKPFNVNAKVERYFFDANDSSDIQELSIQEYNGKFTPSVAMEYSYGNKKFDVLASFSGVVSERKLDPLYGYMVYIKNDSGLVAVYGSLNDVVVNVGDTVKQGQVIAKAGTNTIDVVLNTHLHFALMKNDKLINPNKLFGQNIKSI